MRTALPYALSRTCLACLTQLHYLPSRFYLQVLVGIPAQLAPTVDHYWWFAAIFTVVAVAVDLVVVEIHSVIWKKGFGL